MDVYTAIKNKRAVRKFVDQAIPKQDIEDIVNAGRLSQSSKNMQAWHFVIVTDKMLLAELADCGQFAGHIAGAAMAIAILTPDPDLRFNIMFDAGQSAAYMQLAAFDRGIGSCLATIYDRDRARTLIGFPEDLHIRIAISFGYPATAKEKSPRKSGRRQLSEVVSWDKWNPSVEAHNPFK